MREYFNKCKWSLLTTSVLNLLPIGAGLLLWDRLPEDMPAHWGADGQVNGWVSRPVAVFLLPCIMMAVQWLCFFASGMDPKRRNINDKMMGLVLGIVPAINLVIHTMMYLYALGYTPDMALVMCLLMGVLFLIIGNYLPKCKQSYTLGIKLPWTLNDEENWNATHRLAGKLWVCGGIAMLVIGFLPPIWPFIGMMTVVLVMVAVPTAYSYRLYKKKRDEE